MPSITITDAVRKGIPRTTLTIVDRFSANFVGLLQTILLDRRYFTLRTAKKWLKDHNYANSYYRTTKNEYRFSQTPDIRNAGYFSKKITPSIILVFQRY